MSIQLKREDYKKIKRMDRQQMAAYLQRVFHRGYEAGLKVSAGKALEAKNEKQT